MSLFARMQSTAANYGIAIAMKPMAELAQIPGFPLSAGTADGVDIFLAEEASERLRLFLAAHLFGHCQAWARMPELREIDPFQMTEEAGRATAMRIEGEANDYARAFLARCNVRAAELVVYEWVAALDWEAYSRLLGGAPPLPPSGGYPELRPARGRVRVGAAYFLPGVD
jgi:hypothetical protein